MAAHDPPVPRSCRDRLAPSREIRRIAVILDDQGAALGLFEPKMG